MIVRRTGAGVIRTQSPVSGVNRIVNSDTFTFIFRAAVLGVYGSVFFLSCFFTFSRKKYMRLEERLRIWEIFEISCRNDVLDREIHWLHHWCLANYTAIGPAMMGFSVWIAGTLYWIVEYL